MAASVARLYKCGLNAHLLPEASLACQEPPGVAPERQGQVLLDWAFLSLCQPGLSISLSIVAYVSLVVTTFDKLGREFQPFQGLSSLVVTIFDKPTSFYVKLSKAFISIFLPFQPGCDIVLHLSIYVSIFTAIYVSIYTAIYASLCQLFWQGCGLQYLVLQQCRLRADFYKRGQPAGVGAALTMRALSTLPA